MKLYAQILFSLVTLDTYDSSREKESNATLVDQLVEIPKPLIMNIYAISVFGTAVTLPIMLIIYKFSTSLEVSFLFF